MKESYRILPVYAGDVSGACSALYELGGMIVMHDPSGCNSTYNTFDETRWYDKESLIFLSGLTDMDAVMGNDKKLIADIMTAASEFHPEFIALVNSPIPFLNGTDFPGICRLLEKETGIPTFYIPTNGMHDYTEGAAQAFLCTAKRLVEPSSEVIPGSVNILGMTPLDFAAPSSAGSLKTILEEAGFHILSNWSVDTSLSDIRNSARAAVNLVVSSSGLYAAEYLYETYHTPYVLGIPAGCFKDRVLKALKEAERSGTNQMPYNKELSGSPAEYTLIGDPVIASSLAAAIELRTGKGTRVLCPTEITKGLLRPGDFRIIGEEDAETAVRDAKTLIADPMYRLICPGETDLLPLPHLAISGRMYRKEYPDLFSPDQTALKEII